MKRTIWPLALFLVLTACHSAPQLEPDPEAQTSDLTGEQLIAKSNAARGGEQKLAGIQFVKLTGTWSTSKKNALPITLLIAPGRYLRKIELSSSVTSVKAIDGESAWETSPQAGVDKPTPMGAKEASRFRHLADPQGPIVNPQAKGNKVEVVGKHPWHDRQVYKLKVTFPDGGVNHLYLDAQSFLPVRLVGPMYVAQVDDEVETELIYENYRDVDGVKWPFKETVNVPAARFIQTTVWKNIEINKQPLDDSVFKAPKG